MANILKSQNIWRVSEWAVS